MLGSLSYLRKHRSSIKMPLAGPVLWMADLAGGCSTLLPGRLAVVVQPRGADASVTNSVNHSTGLKSGWRTRRDAQPKKQPQSISRHAVWRSVTAGSLFIFTAVLCSYAVPSFFFNFEFILFHKHKKKKWNAPNSFSMLNHMSFELWMLCENSFFFLVSFSQ